jgi:hypothetical protein
VNTHIETASAAGLTWVKSSYSGNYGNCVEVAALAGGGRALRDSKDADGPALVFGRQGWGAFMAGVITGDFDAA